MNTFYLHDYAIRRCGGAVRGEIWRRLVLFQTTRKRKDLFEEILRYGLTY